jgi:hypothetical protein
MTHEYLDILAARRPDDADVQEVVAACRKLLDAQRAFIAQALADQAAAREAGLTHANIREALADPTLSFGRLVELIRTAAKTLAEQERK